MSALKIGATVQQVVAAPIKGTVARGQLTDAGGMQYLVNFLDADGAPAQRWFTEAEIAEVVAPAPAPAPGAAP